MRLIGEEIISRGVSEQQFDLSADGRRVPGIIWKPDSSDCSALVLLGHGGGLHKRADYILSTARRLVRHYSIAAVAIDANPALLRAITATTIARSRLRQISREGRMQCKFIVLVSSGQP